MTPSTTFDPKVSCCRAQLLPTTSKMHTSDDTLTVSHAT
ncbi:hypothetical protein A2U01_0114893, partial [Trifolium medium]|nr:hypothetical protein [Trifolium medium]